MKRPNGQLKNRINNSLMFEVKYLGPTNVRGSRVKITSYDLKHRNNNKPKSITIGYDYVFNSSTDIGQNWLERNGFKILGKNCNYPRIDIFICKWDFETLCKAFKLSVEV